ncbi:poly-gamma-glutamate hydrolase family protein [Bacillus thuringiensis]|nr:poly-gamma-glutamate hydrolase family protein [Bacillus thuringiensis]
MKKFSISIIVIIIVVAIVLGKILKKEESYTSFYDLQKHEIADIDYRIKSFNRNPQILVMAIHGGNIEIGTGEIALELGKQLKTSTYIFEGLKAKGNRKLHVTSTLYDEPVATSMAKKAKTILSIHGYRDTETEKVYVGGRNGSYREIIAGYLRDAGFGVERAPDKFGGTSKDNIANQSQMQEGVQLELSTKLRKTFFENDAFSIDNRSNTTKTYDTFVHALKKATIKYKKDYL